LRVWINNRSRSRVGRWLLRYVAVVALLVALPSVIVSPQAKPNAATVSIKENGDFRADLGYFFVEDGRLDVYSAWRDIDVIWDNVLHQYVLPRDMEKEVPSGGAPYYHEVYQLDRGEWGRTERNFTQKPARYLDFGPCDAADQINLPNDFVAGLDTGARKTLPRGAKIKGVTSIEEGRLVVVVASTIPNGSPSIYQTGTYPLRVFLLALKKDNWQIVATVQAEEWAYYCGMRTMGTALKDGQPATLLLLYSSFPEGSRIFSVGRRIRTYLIRSNAESQQRQQPI
jgi:hypothetical protein